MTSSFASSDRSPPPAGRRRGRRRVLTVPMVACAADTPSETVEIQVAEGRLRGVRTNGVDAYKGVPYGASVSGAARFKPAKPVAPWSGVRDATRLGTPTLQDPSTVYGVERTGAGRGLPGAERLDPRRRWQGQAGDGLQPRRRLHDRLGRQHGPGRLDAGARARRGGGGHQPSPGRAGLSVPGRAGRGRIRRLGQPGPVRHRAGPEVGPAQHRRVRRRSEQRDDLRRERRRGQDLVPLRHAVGRAAVLQGHHPERAGGADDHARTSPPRPRGSFWSSWGSPRPTGARCWTFPRPRSWRPRRP